jgi:hypothetical protein
VGVGGLKWQLMNDQGPDAKGLFVGANRGISNTEGFIRKKTME